MHRAHNLASSGWCAGPVWWCTGPVVKRGCKINIWLAEDWTGPVCTGLVRKQWLGSDLNGHLRRGANVEGPVAHRVKLLFTWHVRIVTYNTDVRGSSGAPNQHYGTVCFKFFSLLPLEAIIDCQTKTFQLAFVRIAMVNNVWNQREHRIGRVVAIVEIRHFLDPKLYGPSSYFTIIP
jgi:hypothetical protein